MKPMHHLDASTLMAYSAGALAPAFSVVAATHLSVCAPCRRELAEYDRIGGALLDQQEPAELNSALRDAMLDRLKNAHRQPRQAQAPADHKDLLPLPLRPYFGDTYAGLQWRFVAPGMHRIDAAPFAAGGQLMLLRVAPRKSIPEHTHQGSELTCILRGAYDDALGHFGPGDAADLDGETWHQPITSPGAPCICAAATDAPLHFSSWIVRTLQPLFQF